MKIDPWEESLRDAAVRLKNEAPEGLEQRISRAVADAARPEQPPALFRPAVIVFAVAACAASSVDSPSPKRSQRTSNCRRESTVRIFPQRFSASSLVSAEEAGDGWEQAISAGTCSHFPGERK